MTWTKLSDDFGDDTWGLSDEAFRLHVEGLGWSNRKLLDCTIPLDDVRRFAKNPEALDELLAHGFWELGDGVVVIRHHCGYQQTREQVIHRQAVNEANGRRGGRPRKPRKAAEPAPETSAETHSVSDSLTHDETHGDGTGRVRENSTNDVSENGGVLGDAEQFFRPKGGAVADG